MTKQFRVYQTIKMVHYIDADSEEEAAAALRAHLPLDPPEQWDTEVLAENTTSIEEYDPEG